MAYNPGSLTPTRLAEQRNSNIALRSGLTGKNSTRSRSRSPINNPEI